MRVKQTTERKIIPIEYLDNEGSKPEKKRPPVKSKFTNYSKSNRAKKPKAFPKFKANPRVIISRPAFLRKVPKYEPLSTLSLSIIKTPTKNLFETQVSLTLKVSQSVSYFKSSQINKLRVALPTVIVSFKRHKDTNYPKLKPCSAKIQQIKPKTRIPRRRIPAPVVWTSKVTKIQEDFLKTSLPISKGGGTFPRGYTSNVSWQEKVLLINRTAKILSSSVRSTCPSIADNRMEPLKLSLGISLLATENSQETLRGNSNAIKPVSESRNLILPKTGPSESVRIHISNFGKEFSIVEPIGDVYSFIKMEVEKMEEENLLSELLNIKGYLPKGASEAFDKPIFVLLGQDIGEWHYPIAYLLSELYKEIKGEKPNPTLRDFDEYIEDMKNVDSTKEVHLMVTFKPWGKIEILDGRGIEASKIKSFFEKIWGRLETAYLQGLGFFLIVTESRKIPDIENFLSQVKGVSKNVMLPEIPESKTLERYVALTYALLGLEDDDFLKAIEKYEEALKKTIKVLSFFVPRGIDETQEHSFKESHHYPLKVAVFSHLIDLELKKLDERPAGNEFYKFIANLLTTGKIKIESPIRIGEREVIPDIIYNGDDTKAYIEIETLVGTEDPLKKIDTTISKYLLNNKFVLDGHELWIVLRPVSVLIHYEELKQHQKLFKLLYGEVPVKFKVLVYDGGWKLIGIEAFAKKVRGALTETKELREKI